MVSRARGPARSHARQESARSHASQVMPARSQSTRSHANRPRYLFCRVEPVPVGIDMRTRRNWSTVQALCGFDQEDVQGVPGQSQESCQPGVTHRHPGGWRRASKGRSLMSGDHFFSSTQGLWASRHCARTVERRHPGGWRCASKGRLLMPENCFFGSTHGLRASRHCARTVKHAAIRAGAGALPRDDS